MAIRRPSPAILASALLHAGAAGLLFVAWPKDEVLKPAPSSVPVSIISSVEIAAAAADNPSDELVTEDGASAPVETPPAPPVPTPPAPTPPPPAPAPRPTPTPRPTPPRPTPPTSTPPPRTPARPTPTPPRPTPPSPAPKRNTPSLDLDALAGPPRARPNPGRPSTGQQGAGQASQAAGAAAASFNRVYERWNPPCQTPGVNEMRIQMDVTLSPAGRITSGPTLVSPQSDGVWRAVANGAMQALVASQPFDVPPGFEGGRYRPSFNVERACRNR